MKTETGSGTPARSKEGLVNGRPVRLADVARFLRLMQLSIVGAIAIIAGAIVAIVGTRFDDRWAVAGGIGIWISVLVAVVFACRLSHAMGAPVWRVVVAALVFLCVGLLGTLVLFVLHDRATRLLRANGCKVGRFGVSRDNVRSLHEGACGGCGYDIRAIQSGKCPECGTAN